MAVNNLHVPNNKKITGKSTIQLQNTPGEQLEHEDKCRQTCDRGCCIHNWWKNQCFVLIACVTLWFGALFLKRSASCLIWTVSSKRSDQSDWMLLNPLRLSLFQNPSKNVALYTLYIPRTPNNARAPSLAKPTGRPHVLLNLPKWHRGAKQKNPKASVSAVGTAQHVISTCITKEEHQFCLLSRWNNACERRWHLRKLLQK